MSQPDRKTRRTGEAVVEYLAAVPDERRRADATAAVDLIRSVTGAEPEMWGAIVGFGTTTYVTADAKERETMTIGLAARSTALTLYGLVGPGSEDLLGALGPHTTGTSCLYVKRLDDVDREVLAALIRRGWAAGTD